MNPALTQFGDRMSRLTGVRAIMEDIKKTLQASQGKEIFDFSAGNPVILPEIENLWRDYTKELLDSPEYGEVVCRYGSSKGYQPLIEAIATDFNQRYGWNLSDRNILISPGSQSLYFYAANVFGGYTSSGQLKQIVLPLSPDYTGYGGVSLFPEAVIAYKPELDINETAHRFKYRPDFSQLVISENSGCVIFSRPCNPTGNVLTNDEVRKIADMAANYDVPVLIDSAYGPPFPALNFKEMTPLCEGNVIHCMSLSKAGLPGERMGIAIGNESIIKVLESFQTNMCIHSSRYGQAIALRAIKSGKLAALSESVIRPYYQQKFQVIENALHHTMSEDIPWFLHQGEGAIFAWLWLKDLPISDKELYERLKEVGVIVVPGQDFFPGLNAQNWQHKQQCIRISLTINNDRKFSADDKIRIGMQRLAETVTQVYRQNK